MALIDLYMQKYRNLLIKPECRGRPERFLFPAPDGNAKVGKIWRVQSADVMQRELGIEFNMHLFRHLGCYLFLKQILADTTSCAGFSVTSMSRPPCGSTRRLNSRRHSSCLTRMFYSCAKMRCAPPGDAPLVSDEVADGPRYPKHGRDPRASSLLISPPSRWPAPDKELWRIAQSRVTDRTALTIRQPAGDLAR